MDWQSIPCALNMDARFGYKSDENIPEGDVAIKLSISGLRGGDCLVDKQLGRANSIKLMVRFLKHAIINFEARLAKIDGGKEGNEIPHECVAVVTVPAEVADELLDEVSYYQDLFCSEYRGIDDGVTFIGEETELPLALVPEEVQDDVVNTVEACHDGIFRMSPDAPETVETTSNLSMLRTDTEETVASLLISSSDEEMKRYLASTLHSVFVLGGAKVEFRAACSAEQRTVVE